MTIPMSLICQHLSPVSCYSFNRISWLLYRSQLLSEPRWWKRALVLYYWSRRQMGTMSNNENSKSENNKWMLVQVFILLGSPQNFGLWKSFEHKSRSPCNVTNSETCFDPNLLELGTELKCFSRRDSEVNKAFSNQKDYFYPVNQIKTPIESPRIHDSENTGGLSKDSPRIIFLRKPNVNLELKIENSKSRLHSSLVL